MLGRANDAQDRVHRPLLIGVEPDLAMRLGRRHDGRGHHTFTQRDDQPFVAQTMNRRGPTLSRLSQLIDAHRPPHRDERLDHRPLLRGELEVG